MGVYQAAAYLGISMDTLYKYAASGALPAFKLGNRWKFKRSKLDEWMDWKSGPSFTLAPAARKCN